MHVVSSRKCLPDKISNKSCDLLWRVAFTRQDTIKRWNIAARKVRDGDTEGRAMQEGKRTRNKSVRGRKEERIC